MENAKTNEFGDLVDEFGDPIKHQSTSIGQWIAQHGFGAGVGGGNPNLPKDEYFGKGLGETIEKNALPVAGAILGGTGGAAAGALAGPGGIVPGAIGGAGLGSAGGETLNETLKALINKTPLNLNPKEIGIAAGTGMAGEGVGRLAAPVIKAVAPSISDYMGELLGKLRTPGETVPVGDNTIDLDRLIKGTPQQQVEQLGMVTKPIQDVIKKGRQALQAEPLPAGATLSPQEAQELIDTIHQTTMAQTGTPIDPQIASNIAAEGAQNTNIFNQVRSMGKYDKLNDDQIRAMIQTPEFYQSQLENTARRFGENRTTGMSYEDLMALKPKQLTFLQELAQSKTGLLPEQQMGELTGLGKELGGLQAAMKRTQRFMPKDVTSPEQLGFLAPLNLPQRGAETLGSVGGQTLSQALADKLRGK